MIVIKLNELQEVLPKHSKLLIKIFDKEGYVESINNMNWKLLNNEDLQDLRVDYLRYDVRTEQYLIEVIKDKGK